MLLYQDAWNDHGHHCRFIAELRLSAEDAVALGGMRIAVKDQGFRANPPETLKELPRGTASMGESVAYYRLLNQEVPASVRRRYLNVMKDLIAEPKRRAHLMGTQIWEKAFLRETSSRYALKRGGYYIGAPTEDTEPPCFDFSMQMERSAEPHHFNVDFRETNGLPHRTMLFVGRNGTGKTRCLAGLVSALIPPAALIPKTRVEGAKINPQLEISRLIAVSYNAFDEFPLPKIPDQAPTLRGAFKRSRHSYKYCGLRDENSEVRFAEVGTMLDDALGPVYESEREGVLRRVLSKLLGAELADALSDDKRRASSLAALSAGQRLIAAIFTNVVGFVEEGSMILIDEPETHLHPGLLSSVAAALDEILEEFDSYAIVATHSPVLLQQVPSQFVRVFRRIDDVPVISDLEIESFGEDLGELNRRVLGLADPECDFTTALEKLHAKHGSAAGVAKLFAHPLGLPAQSYLLALDDDADAEDLSV